MEPAGGFEHSVSRLQFGCSAIELHRPANHIGPVPHASKGQKRRNHTFGEYLEQATMHLERDAHPAGRGEHVAICRRRTATDEASAPASGEHRARPRSPG